MAIYAELRRASPVQIRRESVRCCDTHGNIGRRRRLTVEAKRVNDNQIGGRTPTTASYRKRVGRLLREPGRILPAIRRRVRSPLVPASERGVTPHLAAKPPVGIPGVQVREEVIEIPDVPRPRHLSRGERIKILLEGVDLQGLGLEIGPSHNPLLPKAEGYNVRIADHLDQAGLIEKYGYKGVGRIEAVDYVVRPGRLTDSVPDRFSYIVASHVAEHTVCLICFLQDCEQLLEPGGVLTLALPDLRYCFDRFRERSGLGRVIDVHHAGHLVHTPGMVAEHFLYNVEQSGHVTWSAGEAGTYRFRYDVDAVQDRVRAATAGEYIDTHHWVFTPHQFRLLVHDLRSLGFISLVERSFTDTIDHEFFVSLSLTAQEGPTRNDLVSLSASDQLALDEARF